MPLFPLFPTLVFAVILTAWLVCVVCGLVMLLFKQHRSRSLYLFFGSTGGLLTSFGASTSLVFASGQVGYEPWWGSDPLIVTWFASIIVGGVVGTKVGYALARKMAIVVKPQ